MSATAHNTPTPHFVVLRDTVTKTETVAQVTVPAGIPTMPNLLVCQGVVYHKVSPGVYSRSYYLTATPL